MFNGSVDKFIIEKYSQLLKLVENNIDGIISNIHLNDNNRILALVILLDQFARNIHRNGNFTRNDILGIFIKDKNPRMTDLIHNFTEIVY